MQKFFIFSPVHIIIENCWVICGFLSKHTDYSVSIPWDIQDLLSYGKFRTESMKNKSIMAQPFLQLFAVDPAALIVKVYFQKEISKPSHGFPYVCWEYCKSFHIFTTDIKYKETFHNWKYSIVIIFWTRSPMVESSLLLNAKSSLALWNNAILFHSVFHGFGQHCSTFH